MRLAICAPVSLPALRRYLGPGDGSSCPQGLGGVPATQLALELLRRGWRLSIYTLDPGVTERVDLEGPRLKVVVGPYRRAGRARDFFRTERAALRSAIAEDGPDLVHAHWTYEFALAGIESGVPTIVSVHDWAPTILRLSPDPYRFMRLLMHFRSIREAHATVAVSPYIQRALSRATGRVSPVVPNALDDDLFVPEPRSFPSGPPRIVSINNGFGKRKNVRVLLQAFGIVRAAHPEAVLQLVGSGYEPDGEAQRWASARGLGSGVRFLGERPYAEVHDLLRQAAILVHPSLEESFGMTILEAMAKRTPVIAGAHSGAVPWVLGHGQAGVLVDVRSAAAIAKAASGLLDRASEWESYSRRGYEAAYERFRLTRVVDDYVSLYREFLAGGSR